MRTIRKSQDRGQNKIDWLQSWHSFSFGSYYDPSNIRFGPLRVINEDIIQPGGGFPTHGHSDMEIITYILSGELAHKDNLGTGSVIRPGEVQMMRAGSGIQHSEFNPSDDNTVHLLQIWIMPDEKGLKPLYQQKTFAPEEMDGKFRLLVSPDAAEGSLSIRQDARLYAARLKAGESASVPLDAARKYWLQIARGAVQAGDTALSAGDALTMTQESGTLDIAATVDAEVLLFDL